MNEVISASKKGDFDRVQQLIPFQRKDLPRALIVASRYGHADIVSLLLQNRVNVHASGDASLYNATQNGHIEVVRILLEYGATIHSEIFRVAVETGQIDIVQLFLEADRKRVQAMISYAFWTVGRSGSIELTNLLIDYGADIHSFNDAALVTAALHKHSDLVTYLLQEGADANAQNGRALQHVVKRSDLPLTDLLLKYGANPNSPDVMRVACRAGSIEIILLLEKYGGILPDDAITIASQYGHLDLIAFFLDRGVAIPDMSTVIAASYGNFDIVRYLIKNGANVDNDALLYAIIYDDVDAVEFLFEHGADPTAIDSETLIENVESVDMLTVILEYLTTGMEERVVDPYWFEYALEHDEIEMLKVLIQYSDVVPLDPDVIDELTDI